MRKQKQKPIKFGDSTEKPSKQRRQKMSSELKIPYPRKIDFTISKDNVHSQVEAFLRTVGFVNSKEDVSDMELVLNEDKLTYTAKCVINKESEVKLTYV